MKRFSPQRSGKVMGIAAVVLLLASPFSRIEIKAAAEIEVTADFAVASDPPLLKKVAMFNSGLAGIPNYERDARWLAEVYSDSLRVDLGIGAQRFFLANTVEGTADKPAFDFAALDQWARILKQQNVLPYPSWCYVPKPLQKDGDWRTIDTGLPNWQASWKNIYAAYSRHFRERGIKIGYHEVYNEPDLRGARGGVFLNHEQFTSGVFFQLYKYGALGLREGDPDAVIGGPGYADGRLAGDFIDFITKERLPLDFYSFHTYLGPSWPDSYQRARQALASNQRYNTTEIHLNEVNWMSSSMQRNGTSPNDHFGAAARNLDMVLDLVGKTDIAMAHWAQFMESTVKGDTFGIIQMNGHRKAAHMAFKIYADMPESRVLASAPDPMVKVMASTEGHRATAVVWSSDATERAIRLQLRNLPFTAKAVRMYRVDREHASFIDDAPEDLVPEPVAHAGGKIVRWNGVLNGRGVLYFVADRSAEAHDFQPVSRDVQMGNIIRTHHLFEYTSAKPKTSYRYFDRRSWRAFLGMGEESTANTACGVTAENLPPVIDVRFHTTGPIQHGNDSLLGMRVDYLVDGKTSKSVFFHDGVYSTGDASIHTFGAAKAIDRVIKAKLVHLRLKLADYAPKDWNNGRILISFQMQNTGPGTRSEISVHPGR